MKRIPGVTRYRLTMKLGHAYEQTYIVEPIQEVRSAAWGTCVSAAWRKPDGTWDPDGLFRCDLIVSMEPLLDMGAAA